MTVFNRRNAAVGWVAVVVGKRVLKKKAKHAVPAIDQLDGILVAAEDTSTLSQRLL